MLNFASIKQQKGRCFFYLLLFAVFGWAALMQFFGADERLSNQYSDSLLYTGSFVWEKTDGERSLILQFQGSTMSLLGKQ